MIFESSTKKNEDFKSIHLNIFKSSLHGLIWLNEEIVIYVQNVSV